MQRRSDSASYPHNSIITFFAFKHFVTLSSVFVPDTPITRGNVFFKMSLQIKYICSAKHWYICTLKYISTIYIYYVYVGYVLVNIIYSCQARDCLTGAENTAQIQAASGRKCSGRSLFQAKTQRNIRETTTTARWGGTQQMTRQGLNQNTN